MNNDMIDKIDQAVILLREKGYQHTHTHCAFANETGRLDYGMRFGKPGIYGIASLEESKGVWVNPRTVQMIITLLTD